MGNVTSRTVRVRGARSIAVLAMVASAMVVPTAVGAEEAVACPPEADAIWVGGSDLDFEDPANWDGGVVPPDGSDVCLLRPVEDPESRVAVRADHRFVRLVTDTPLKVSGRLQVDGPEPSRLESVEMGWSDATLAVPAVADALTLTGDFVLGRDATLEVRGPLNGLDGAPVVVQGSFFNYPPYQPNIYGWPGTPWGGVAVTEPDTIPPGGVDLIAMADEFVLPPVALAPTDSDGHLALRDGRLVLLPGAPVAELEIAAATTEEDPFAGGSESDLYITVRNTGTQTATAGFVSLGGAEDSYFWDTHARCTGPYGVAVCRLPTLAPGEVTRLHFLVTPSGDTVIDPHEGGTFELTVSAAALESAGPVEQLELRYHVSPRQDPTGVDRVFGTDRVRTAVEISRLTWPDPGPYDTGHPAEAVVLARADDFPDALAGAPLARNVGGPLLLTDPDTLPPATAAELVRLLPVGHTVHVLGGEAAVSEAVVEAVEDLGYDVDRIWGVNRFATAAAVVSRVEPLAGVWLADGTQFPDAVLAGGAAAAQAHVRSADCCHVVLLTNGDELPSETAAIIDRVSDEALYAVGGPAAAAVPTARPFVGANRYETAAALAQRGFFQRLLVTGANWPDALAVGARGGAILLVPPSGMLPSSLQELLATRTSVTIVGGPGAVSEAMAAQIEAALDAP